MESLIGSLGRFGEFVLLVHLIGDPVTPGSILRVALKDGKTQHLGISYPISPGDLRLVNVPSVQRPIAVLVPIAPANSHDLWAGMLELMAPRG